MILRCLTVSAALLIPAQTWADATMELSDEAGATVVVYKIKDGRVRFEQKGEDMVGLFDSRDGSMTMLRPSAQEYFRMDREKAAEVSETVNAAMAQMQQQLAALPPEQREMMKQYLPGMAQQKEGPSFTAERTGKRQEVAGVRCELVRLSRDGQPFKEACVTSHDALGMSDADHETLKTMYDTLASFSRQFSASGGLGPGFGEFGGVPVMTREADGSEQVSLSSFSDDGLDGAQFDVPAGYTERSMGMPPR